MSDLIERLTKYCSGQVELGREAATELSRLTAENAALRADAERYRWILDNATVFFKREQRIEVAVGKFVYSRCPTESELTDTLDSARAKESGNG